MAEAERAPQGDDEQKSPLIAEPETSGPPGAASHAPETPQPPETPAFDDDVPVTVAVPDEAPEAEALAESEAAAAAPEPAQPEPEPTADAEPEPVEPVEPVEVPVEPVAVESGPGANESEPAAAAPGPPTASEPPVGAEATAAATDAPAAAPPEAPGATPTKRPSAPSRIVEGVVTAVSANEVELTLDDGRPAVINRRNFDPGDIDPSEILSVGDRAFGAELSREDPKQRVVLSRTWALKRKAWEKVTQVAGLNESLTGTVVSVGGKGVVVDVGVRGFVPTSHLELEPVADLSSYKGQTLELKVLEADPQRERLVLSRRSLLLKEQRKRSHEMLSKLSPGQTCTGRITSLTDYGAFVDIGGVNGLVHLSELSWRRVRRPAEVVSLGQEVEVKVLDVKAKKRRVSLSIRRLTPDPLSVLTKGEVLQGMVTRLVDFGAFVSVGEDLEGLVHLSELAEYRVSTPEEVVAPGDQVGVKVLSVDKKRRRIELSIRRAAEFGG